MRRADPQRFWDRVPLAALRPLAAAVFLTFGAFGFLVDVVNGGRNPPAVLAALVVLSGAVAVAYLLISVRRRLQLLALVIPLQIAAVAWLTLHSTAPLEAAALQRRLRVDAIGALVGIVGGYVLFMVFIVREGLARVRVQAEIELAREIHEALVPAVSLRTPWCELHGRSLPVGEVGGDLVDALLVGGRPLAFVADVSGHGVPAGTLMGMLKAGLRVALAGEAGPSAAAASATAAGRVLVALNDALVELTRPNMFATAAVMTMESPTSVAYALAGHPPILHVRPGGAAVRLSQDGMALGIRAGEPYPVGRVAVAPGDLLAIVTDGIVETTDAHDRELGLDAIEAALGRDAAAPLPELVERLLRLAHAHGSRRDDQTLLVLRVLEGS
jgi:hypothetical protein